MRQVAVSIVSAPGVTHLEAMINLEAMVNLELARLAREHGDRLAIAAITPMQGMVVMIVYSVEESS